MATGINCVHFFIYVLCIVSVLCPGYVIPPPTLPPTTTLAPPSEYCYPIRSCPNNKWMCLDYCGERGFGKGVGTCVRDNLCCCIE
ncbi:LCR-like protein [Medicago truncatula]|uniref:LCR-like protein n=1 Tax=Medicago truncatula TaxID=3880 RepID=A0A072VKC3_MEDTR|nr:LCR-like protein [Medicago truncatula]